MFDFLKRKEPDIADTLATATLAGRDKLYRHFRESLGFEESAVCGLELTYFAAAVMTHVYSRGAPQSGRDEILVRFTSKILVESVASSKEGIALETVANELAHRMKVYQIRYAEYSSLLQWLLSPGELSEGNAATALAIHAFEAITKSRAPRDTVIVAATTARIQDFVIDTVIVVRKTL